LAGGGYPSGIDRGGNVRTGALSISSKNESARYSIILATHGDKGLECWNPVKWGLDPAAGQTVSEKRVPQEALFDDRLDSATHYTAEPGPRPRSAICGLKRPASAFSRVSCDPLSMSWPADGYAVREQPLDAAARSPWPDTSIIRFYADPS
jgi:hypothetical protein